MDLLQKKDEERYKVTGVRRCWFIRSIEEVFLEVKKEKDMLKGRRPRTFDFATMYTRLEHTKIKKNVRIAVNEARDYLAIQMSRDGRRTQASLQDLMSTEEIMALVDFVVDNTFFCTNNGTIRRQKIGIPMGTNSAPELANLTLYVDEAKYIDEIEASQGTLMAGLYAFNFRFIDDILSWDLEPPSAEIYGLNWNETTEKDGSVTFLGGKVSIKAGRLDISIFDKEAEWDFPVIRYPHAISNVPYHQPAGVFQGQLCRFRVVCNSIKAFKHATTQLTLKMFSRGHSVTALIKGWNRHLVRFAKDRITNYSRLRQWFKRMLRWVFSHQSSTPHCSKSTKRVWKPKQGIHKNENEPSLNWSTKLHMLDDYLSKKSHESTTSALPSLDVKAQNHLSLSTLRETVNQLIDPPEMMPQLQVPEELKIEEALITEPAQQSTLNLVNVNTMPEISFTALAEHYLTEKTSDRRILSELKYFVSLSM